VSATHFQNTRPCIILYLEGRRINMTGACSSGEVFPQPTAGMDKCEPSLVILFCISLPVYMGFYSKSVCHIFRPYRTADPGPLVGTPIVASRLCMGGLTFCPEDAVVSTRCTHAISKVSSSPGRSKIFLFSTSSRLVLGPTHPPIQWVPGALSPGVERLVT
jgi:hypothetical protein